MGQLIDGVWYKDTLLKAAKDGEFKRKDSSIRNWITADGSAGSSGDAGFKAESGRYHLYISHACPWAHRTAIFRKLKGLEDIVSMSVTHWIMDDMGWSFKAGDGVIADPVNSSKYVHQIYQAADDKYSGRATVPILWDKDQKTIVSNESSEIIRMFNSAFDGIGGKSGDYYPVALHNVIDTLNARIYETLNNGVYRSGFAQTQSAYEAAVFPLFETLNWLEAILSEQRYLAGSDVTEADWRLFTTLIRFDVVYHGHFKCNIQKISDYPNISNYLRDLFQVEGVAQTTDFKHIKGHYYGSHESINPTRIIPAGPVHDFTASHNRASF